MPRIQVLGPGCPKCRKLAANAEQAAAELGGFTVERITDLVEILKFDASVTPALAVDGKVLAAGRVLSVQQLKELIATNCRL